MESIPNILVCQIYDNFVNLCIIECKEKFSDVLDELVIKTELVDIGFKSKRELRNSFKILCYDRHITNGILDMEKIDENWILRHSWMYVYDDPI